MISSFLDSISKYDNIKKFCHLACFDVGDREECPKECIYTMSESINTIKDFINSGRAQVYATVACGIIGTLGTVAALKSAGGSF